MRERTSFSDHVFGPMEKCFSELLFGSGALPCTEGATEINIKNGIVFMGGVAIAECMASLQNHSAFPLWRHHGRNFYQIQHQEMLCFSLIAILVFLLKEDINFVFFFALTAGR